MHEDKVDRLTELICSHELSTYRENILEQIFCAELTQCAWAQVFPPIDVARSFVDFQSRCCGRRSAR